MNQTEFIGQFLPCLQRYFPGIGTWLDRQGETKAAWFDTLHREEVDDCCEAIRRIHSGDETEPKGRDAYPKTIRQVCRRLREARNPTSRVDTPQPKIIDGQQVFICPQCQDSGLLSIFSAATVRALVQGIPWGDKPTLDNPVGVACGCPMGDRMVNLRRNPRGLKNYFPFPRFDIRRHVLCECGPYRGHYPYELQCLVARERGEPEPERVYDENKQYTPPDDQWNQLKPA